MHFTRSRRVVERPRLLEMLAASELTILKAPAGYGKSVLIDQWIESCPADTVAIRLNLDQRDRQPAWLEGRIDRLAPGDPGESLPARLCRRQNPVLVLDNADAIAGSDTIGFLIDLMSDCAGLRLVVASRGQIGLPLGRRRLDGSLTEMTADDLRFTRDECEAWLGLSGLGSDMQLSYADFASNLRGWPLAYGFAFAEGRDATAVRAVNGGWRAIADYYEEEVCNALSQDLLEFLMKCSALHEIRPEFCDGVLGYTDSRSLIEACVDAGVDLQPADAEGESSHFHPLFADFLRRRLGHAQTERISRDAISYLSQRKDFAAACTLAIEIGEHRTAAALLSDYYRTVDARTDFSVMSLARRIAPKERNRQPYVLLGMAVTLIIGFHLQEARECLNRTRRLLADASLEDGLDLQEIETILLHREMLLALYENKDREVQKLSIELLERIDLSQPRLRNTIFTALIHVSCERFRFFDAERYYLQARHDAYQSDELALVSPIDTFHAEVLFEMGRGEEATEYLMAIIADVRRRAPAMTHAVVPPAIMLASLQVERGEYESADRLLNSYLHRIEQFGFVSLIIKGRVALARVMAEGGDVEGGLSVLQQSPASAGEVFERVRTELALERLAWLVKLGRDAEAATTARSVHINLNELPLPPKAPTRAEETFAFAWVGYARARNKLDPARQVAQRWLRFSDGARAVLSSIRWTSLLAGILVLQNDARGASRVLRTVLPQAAAGGYRRSFLEQGPLLAGVLKQISNGADGEMFLDFIDDLLLRIRPDERDLIQPGEHEEGVGGSLTATEKQILKLVSRGYLNREIGDALGMTEGTVKWYMQSVFEKMGVRRRSLAVLKAKDLNL